jgi:hypothetical protein
MKRIKLIFAVGVVMVAMLALNAGSAMANEIKDVDIDGDDFEITLADGSEVELEDDDIFGFSLLDLDDLEDLEDLDDDDDDNVSINEGNDQGVVRVVDRG